MNNMHDFFSDQPGKNVKAAFCKKVQCCCSKKYAKSLFWAKNLNKLLAGKFKFFVRIVHTEARFARFLSGGFTTMAVINPPK